MKLTVLNPSFPDSGNSLYEDCLENEREGKRGSDLFLME